MTALQLTVAVIGAGIAVRIAGVTASAIWFDEAVSTFNSRLPFFQMVQAAKYTNSPPLWEIILWLDTHILGESLFTLRLPSLIVSFFILWLVYQLTLKFGLSTHQSCFVLFLVALLPSQIWMAQDARVYAVLLALYLIAIWFVINNRWVGFTACAGLLLYGHFSAPFYLISLYLGMIYNNGLNWKSIRYTLISGLAISIAFVPWVSALLLSIQTSSNFPKLSPFYLLISIYQALFLDEGWMTDKWIAWVALGTIAISLVTALVFGIVLLFKQLSALRRHQNETGTNQRYILLSIFALGPLLCLIFLGIFKNIVYYRALTVMVIPMIIWTVYTLGYGLKRPIFKYGFVISWIILVFIGLSAWSPAAKGGNIRMLTDLIDHQWQAGDVIYHVTGTTYLPFNFYQPNKPTFLFNEPLHLWLLPSELADMYGLKRASLESLSYKRLWIVYARDPLVPGYLRARIEKYTQTGVLVGRVDVWQFAPINVYRVDEPQP